MDNKLKDKQYNDSSKFNARILIHSKYGTSKVAWPVWLFDQYQIPENANIIEFGCGNGLIWKANLSRINPSWKIILSDFSEGMIKAAKESIGFDLSNICYEVIDINTYKTKSESFDRIIANHMLYHIENREPVLDKISQMLKAEGEFYCSTIGESNMIEMKKLINEFTGNNYSKTLGSITESFSLENGKDQLLKYFSCVDRIDFNDSLEITDSLDLVNYVLSCNDLTPGVTVLPNDQKDAFKLFLDKKLEKNGKIHISKSSGTFIAHKNDYTL